MVQAVQEHHPVLQGLASQVSPGKEETSSNLFLPNCLLPIVLKRRFIKSAETQTEKCVSRRVWLIGFFATEDLQRCLFIPKMSPLPALPKIGYGSLSSLRKRKPDVFACYMGR